MKDVFGLRLFLLFIVIIALVMAYTKRQNVFSADEILAQSQYQNRTFSGKVEEISNHNLKAYLIEEHSVPLVAVSFQFNQVGRAYEPLIGLGVMAENTLLEGTKTYNRKQLRELMNEYGIKFSFGVDDDVWQFSISYVKKFEKEALEVIYSILYEPLFEEQYLNLARQQLAVVKKQQQENPEFQLGKLIKENMYASHPYGRESIPDTKVLEKISAQDIHNYMEDYLAQDNLTVGIAGDINKTEAEGLLARLFGSLSAHTKAKKIEDVLIHGGNNEKTIKTSAQNFNLIKTSGVKRNDKEFYPLYLANLVFGGSGLTSRLSQSIREKEGLTYGIYSYFSEKNAETAWNIYFSATPDNAQKIKSILQVEYDKFYQNGITEEELKQVKKSLTASFNLRFADLITIAQMLDLMQVQNLGRDFLEKRQSYVNNVTLKDVNQAIKTKMPKQLRVEDKVYFFEIIGNI